MLTIMNSAHATMNKWALEKIEICNESVVLDVGCGGGKTIQLLSKMNRNGKIHGIDYSEQAVKDSRRVNKLDVEKGKVEIQLASVTHIPFQDRSFDVITAFQTHYFWPDLEYSVKEVFRILKEDGCFIIVAEKFKIHYHMKEYKTKEEMQGLLEQIGFNKVEFIISPNDKWICIKGIK